MVAVGIVGAGPAGLVLAHLLQRAGISFVLLERQAQADLGRRPQAGLVEYRTVQQLAQAGLAGSVVEFSVPNHRCEFRTPGESAVIEYSALTGGRPHYIYPQHELVGLLAGALAGTGADIRWAHTVRSVRPQPGGVAVSGADEHGRRFEVRCEVAVGCEGSHSAVAAAMTGLRITEQRLPVRWLSVIGAAPPLHDHTVYAAHPAGFAGQMRRGAAQTRYYLEVPVTDTAANWPQERIRAELATRLIAPGQLDSVPFGDPAVLDLRTRVAEPMQEGRLFLAGDAAHLITPAGGKGMNLAVQDAIELAYGLISRFGPGGDGNRLAAYSHRRLAHIWRTQAFSSWFLHLILASLRDGDESGSAVPGGFARGLRNGWVRTLQDDVLLARWFAHAYAGVDGQLVPVRRRRLAGLPAFLPPVVAPGASLPGGRMPVLPTMTGSPAPPGAPWRPALRSPDCRRRKGKFPPSPRRDALIMAGKPLFAAEAQHQFTAASSRQPTGMAADGWPERAKTAPHSPSASIRDFCP